MKNRIVNATHFKANCLALLDEVQDQGATITVTKRGRPWPRSCLHDKNPGNPQRNFGGGKSRSSGISSISIPQTSGTLSAKRNRNANCRLAFWQTPTLLYAGSPNQRKLSHQQNRILEDSVRRREPVAISAISLGEWRGGGKDSTYRGGRGKDSGALGLTRSYNFLPRPAGAGGGVVLGGLAGDQGNPGRGARARGSPPRTLALPPGEIQIEAGRGCRLS